SRPGIVSTGLLLTSRPNPEKKPLVIYLSGEGKAKAAAPGGPIEKLFKAGNSVTGLDLRGMGETAPGIAPPNRPDHLGTDWKESFLSLHLGQPLLGQRVLDLLSIIEIPLAKGKVAKIETDLRLIAVGSAGPIALHAAVLDQRIKSVTIERSIVSWASVV